MTWLWRPYLAHAQEQLAARLATLEPYPVPEVFQERRATTGPRSRPSEVITHSWAVRARGVRQARAACVQGDPQPQVLNFVINPDHRYELPFFGADLVTLPGGHLIAIDLQPVIKADEHHTAPVWERLEPLFERWRSRLPDGGPIPAEAEPYFSSGFLWTRLPLDETERLDSAVLPAFQDYLALYLDLLQEAEPVGEARAGELLAGQQRYTDYRAEKDPARGMLTRFYGSEWTERYIHDFLFDLQRPSRSETHG